MMFSGDNDRELVDILMRCWCPEFRLYDKKNKYRDQYQAWAKAGYMETTPEEAIDYNYVRARVVEDNKYFKIDSISVDRFYKGFEFATKLDKEIGGTENSPKIIACGLGFASMAGLTQEFERRMINLKLNHGGNPILRWMVDNVAVDMDPAGSLKPNKSKSQGKIDGVIGMLLALNQLMRMPERRSVWMPS